jgi:hypothetical protein
MARQTTRAGKLGKLQKLSAALSANGADLPQLEISRAQLAALLTEAQEATLEQAAMTAGKQQATQRLKTSVIEGERLANVLQLAVKQHYGIRAEKLAEFGLPPFRGRNKTAKATPGTPAPTPTPKPTPAPEVHAAPPASTETK